MEILNYYSDITGLIASYFINVFSLIAVFFGVRQISKKIINKRLIILSIIGILLCLVNSGTSFYSANSIKNVLTAFNSIPEENELPEDFLNHLSNSKRKNITQNRAKFDFRRTGKFSRYIDINGEWKLYSPTEKDLRKWQKEVEAKLWAQYKIAHARSVGWYWLVSLVVTVFLGWASSSNKYGKVFGFNR